MDEDLQALKQQQAHLARILTSTTDCGDEHNIAVQAIDLRELREHRDTLIRKRAHQTAHMLPHVARALGKQFPQYYHAFAQRHHFNSIDAIVQDAIGFSCWLETQSLAIPWLQACTKLDRARCQWQTSPSWYFKLLTLSYDLANWKTNSETPNKKTAVWIFLHSGSVQRVWRLP